MSTETKSSAYSLAVLLILFLLFAGFGCKEAKEIFERLPKERSPGEDPFVEPVDPPSETPPTDEPTPPEPELPRTPQKFTGPQRTIADQIISVFENDTPVLQYAYAENLGDGRGITAGRAGFTSATWDMLEVIERYRKIDPGHALIRYIPRLRELSQTGSGSTVGLEGLVEAWKKAAQDSRFRAAQDGLVDDWYYLPAFERFEALGLTWPVSLLCLYDANIQHGSGNDPDGLPAMIQATTQQAGGTPKTGVAESVWIAKFQQVRRAVLSNAHNPDTRDVWRQSVPRVDELSEIIEAGNVELEPAIQVNPWRTNHVIPQG